MVSARCGPTTWRGQPRWVRTRRRPDPAMASAVVDVPLLNSEPVTLLLIASGLLLVGYAGRRNEWKAFGRRSAR